MPLSLYGTKNYWQGVKCPFHALLFFPFNSDSPAFLGVFPFAKFNTSSRENLTAFPMYRRVRFPARAWLSMVLWQTPINSAACLLVKSRSASIATCGAGAGCGLWCFKQVLTLSIISVCRSSNVISIAINFCIILDFDAKQQAIGLPFLPILHYGNGGNFAIKLVLNLEFIGLSLVVRAAIVILKWVAISGTNRSSDIGAPGFR